MRFRLPLLPLSLLLTSLSIPLSAQEVPAETVAPEPQVDADTAGDASALPSMAEVEQAWQRGDFIFVRDGLKQLAEETGTPLAQYRYARVLVEGRGGPRDMTAALEWLQKAVAQNHSEAATLLARLLLRGDAVGAPYDPERAATLLASAAARGQAEAQYYLAQLSQSGTGTPQDPQAAFNWFLAAAEQDYVAAQYELAKAYSSGTGTEQSNEEGLRWLEKAADAGHIEAQYFMANALETGGGVAQDRVAALRWYRRAAEAGMPRAQRILGTRYLTGDGVDANPDEALRWLEPAAKAGEPGAILNLGSAYTNGTGLAQDDALAVQWYRRGVQAEIPRAMTALGQLTEEGRGLPQDLDAAIKLYRSAATAEEPSARLRLGQMAVAGLLDGRVAPQRAVPWVLLAMQQDEDGAGDWLQSRADEGMRTAQLALGQELLSDPDRSADGIALLTAAAEAGETAAQALLGQAWATGDYGLEQDYVTAHSWLNLAAAGGNAGASETRDVIAALMTPEQIAQAQTRARDLYAAQAKMMPQTEQSVVTGQ
ncbi:SEL1-like repeat protein [Puniceibacterium sp. IMCC21224]|uniref:SEL1-like repeat protein n=1 Tax=Puniceibacterium sp. IMCC21224 TaxID=1618204 RepID=UPI00064DB1BD|nr:SEL1-like repeat protein [Puniceibacterium sp. IMCC21224]KMK64001.1 TPR repeat-containing protein [Puniceibacterium sp. IMCC21224]